MLIILAKTLDVISTAYDNNKLMYIIDIQYTTKSRKTLVNTSHNNNKLVQLFTGIIGYTFYDLEQIEQIKFKC